MVGPHNFVRLAAEDGEEERGPAYIELVRGQDATLLRTGEEVVISYGDGQRLTPDEMLSYYGFIEQPQPTPDGIAAADTVHTQLCTLGSSRLRLIISSSSPAARHATAARSSWLP